MACQIAKERKKESVFLHKHTKKNIYKKTYIYMTSKDTMLSSSEEEAMCWFLHTFHCPYLILFQE